MLLFFVFVRVVRVKAIRHMVAPTGVCFLFIIFILFYFSTGVCFLFIIFILFYFLLLFFVCFCFCCNIFGFV